MPEQVGLQLMPKLVADVSPYVVEAVALFDFSARISWISGSGSPCKYPGSQ
jgi:hypothetical protein